MSALSPTPRELMLDRQGRPYFLWDVDMTLAEIRSEWDAVQKYLGTSRAMWSWLLDSWKEPGAVG